MKTDSEIVRDFILQHDLAVVATVAPNALPSAAVVGIIANSKMEIFFGTYKDSHKYRNLQANSRVSLVIGWEQGRTVQYDGEAKLLAGNAQKEFEKAHLALMQTIAKYVPAGESAYFKVTPRRIRYTDLAQDPWNVIELKF